MIFPSYLMLDMPKQNVTRSGCHVTWLKLLYWCFSSLLTVVRISSFILLLTDFNLPRTFFFHTCEWILVELQNLIIRTWISWKECIRQDVDGSIDNLASGMKCESPRQLLLASHSDNTSTPDINVLSLSITVFNSNVKRIRTTRWCKRIHTAVNLNICIKIMLYLRLLALHLNKMARQYETIP